MRAPKSFRDGKIVVNFAVGLDCKGAVCHAVASQGLETCRCIFLNRT